MVVGYCSHFDSGELPNALFKRIQLLHIWHLNDHTVDVFVETRCNYFHLLLQCDVMVVELQLCVKSRFEVCAFLGIEP